MAAPYRSAQTVPNAAPAPLPAVALKLKPAFNPWLRMALGYVIPLAVALVVLLAIDARVERAPGTVGPWQIVLDIAVVSAVALAGVYAYYYRKAKALAQENNNALGLLRAGRLDEAGRIFEDLARRARRQNSLRAVFLMNLGLVKLRRSEPDEALSLLDSVQKSGWLARPSVLPNHAALLIALATAQFARGELDAVRHWIALAQKQVVANRRGMLLLIETLLAAREGAFERAVSESAARWQEAEGVSVAFQMRALRVVRAFALRSLPRPAEEPAATARDAEVTTLLAGVQPATKGEFDYLARAWPEFKVFLTAQNLRTEGEVAAA